MTRPAANAHIARRRPQRTPRAAGAESSPLEIEHLIELDLHGLRRLWSQQYGCEAPLNMSRELMIQAIAYRLQEERHGGLSRGARAKLLSGRVGDPSDPKVAGRHMGDDASASRAGTRRTIKAGTRFLREWQGRTHEVIAATDGGFLYAGTRYRSLSQIARTITGTRWSGPAFFGIKRPSATPPMPPSSPVRG